MPAELAEAATKVTIADNIPLLYQKLPANSPLRPSLTKWISQNVTAVQFATVAGVSERSVQRARHLSDEEDLLLTIDLSKVPQSR